MGTVTAINPVRESQALSANTPTPLARVSLPAVAAPSNVQVHDIVAISAQALALQANGASQKSAEVTAIAPQQQAATVGIDIVAISAQALQAARIITTISSGNANVTNQRGI